jgi:hypothetical protein
MHDKRGGEANYSLVTCSRFASCAGARAPSSAPENHATVSAAEAPVLAAAESTRYDKIVMTYYYDHDFLSRFESRHPSFKINSGKSVSLCVTHKNFSRKNHRRPTVNRKVFGKRKRNERAREREREKEISHTFSLTLPLSYFSFITCMFV